MTLKIKDLPEFERPYEKLERYGASSLSDAELLAIIIKTGSKEDTSVSLAQKILLLDNLKKGLRFLNYISIEELLKIKGVGKVKAFQLKAVVELAKRLSKPLDINGYFIKSPIDIFNLLVDDYKYETKEILKLIIMNNKNKVLKIIDIAKGHQNSVSAPPKEILIEPIRMQADSIILVHNHPSRGPYS